MIYAAAISLALLALIGHAAFWVSLVNFLNAFAFPHGLLRWVNRVCLLLCVAIPSTIAGLVLWLIARIGSGYDNNGKGELLFDVIGWLTIWYISSCWGVGAWAVFVWLVRRLRNDESSFLVRANHTQHFNVAKLRGENLSGNRRAAVCSRIPGNQIFQFHTQTKQIALPGLPPALDGFSITHLSDLHFAGHIQREFHEEVVRQTNRLEADMIAITGDIVDRPHCIDWFESTLGQLRARRGVYFILGNHESRRCSPADVRRALVELGLVDLGGKAAAVEHNGAHVLLAGNELPWLAAPLAASELPMSPSDPEILSIALSHSPDQFAWAQREGYKLMLAGHVHGGQIRLPVVGPLLSPSRHGVRYAGGAYFRPPTLLHVTRGVSGMIPLRFNCPPEVAKLVLHAPR